jgi:hypothetical protein
MPEPPEYGCNGIETAFMLDAGDELRFFSCGSKVSHGRAFNALEGGVKDIYAILVHSLRRDGFTYLRSRGDWARFTTKPFALLGDDISINVSAPYGEVVCQITDGRNEPIEGYSFEDCEPLVYGDSLAWRPRWRGNSAKELVDTLVRLEVRFRQARLYAIRGPIHFVDGMDIHMLEDGQPIDRSLWDF